MCVFVVVPGDVDCRCAVGLFVYNAWSTSYASAIFLWQYSLTSSPGEEINSFHLSAKESH